MMEMKKWSLFVYPSSNAKILFESQWQLETAATILKSVNESVLYNDRQVNEMS